MSAFHHSRIVEEFRRTGGTLTGPQIAAAVGFGWRRDLHEMRKAGYLLVEDAAGLWHLDLEALPDVGRADGASDEAVRCAASGAIQNVAVSSPDADTHPQVEGEPEPLRLPVGDVEAPPLSPYDVEAHEAA